MCMHVVSFTSAVFKLANCILSLLAKMGKKWGALKHRQREQRKNLDASFVHSRRGQRLKCFHTAVTKDEVIQDPKMHFRVEFHIHILDILVQQFEKHFTDFRQRAKLQDLDNFYAGEVSITTFG